MINNIVKSAVLEVLLINRKQVLFANLVFLLLLSIGTVDAQVMQERRVYYLDVTESLKCFGGTPNIWKDVTLNLKKAINQINDETTEIMVIPFTSKDHPLHPLGGRFYKATAADKQALCALIDKQQTFKHFTHIQQSFIDYYSLRVDPSKINYFFLMTDGQNSGGEMAAIKVIKKMKNETEA